MAALIKSVKRLVISSKPETLPENFTTQLPPEHATRRRRTKDEEIASLSTSKRLQGDRASKAFIINTNNNPVAAGWKPTEQHVTSNEQNSGAVPNADADSNAFANDGYANPGVTMSDPSVTSRNVPTTNARADKPTPAPRLRAPPAALQTNLKREESTRQQVAAAVVATSQAQQNAVSRLSISSTTSSCSTPGGFQYSWHKTPLIKPSSTKSSVDKSAKQSRDVTEHATLPMPTAATDTGHENELYNQLSANGPSRSSTPIARPVVRSILGGNLLPEKVQLLQSDEPAALTRHLRELKQTYTWYFGPISRTYAENCLEEAAIAADGHGDGLFLVRDTSQHHSHNHHSQQNEQFFPLCLSMCVRKPGDDGALSFVHARIRYDTYRNTFSLHSNVANEAKYNSVVELVQAGMLYSSLCYSNRTREAEIFDDDAVRKTMFDFDGIPVVWKQPISRLCCLAMNENGICYAVPPSLQDLCRFVVRLYVTDGQALKRTVLRRSGFGRP